ncbi:MAG TPA: ATP-dependent protease subunit HslV [Candidatus Ornithoclostridium faecavium]|nr:ATP-dependent protease subunit HslV [Candidatus Ornithoclostridium faecavium]
MSTELRGTTICAVRKDGKIAIAGDGQVTMGESVILKGTAKKVKRIYDDKVVIGFAGSVSDAFTLSEKFEKMLQKYSGNLMRSAVELAELWRNDKLPRKLEAMMIVADKDELYIVSGSGDVIDPDGDACAIGSGGNYALAAARALLKETDLPAKDIAYKALKIASELCVFTNDNIIVEEV